MTNRIAIRAATLAVLQLEERARGKGYQLRIEYSQNGKVISDELFKEVCFFYTPGEAQTAVTAALVLAEEYGCGTAAVYFTPADQSRRQYLGTMNASFRSRTQRLTSKTIADLQTS